MCPYVLGMKTPLKFQCSIYHGLTRDLGERTDKDFFNLFIADDFTDEIIQFTVAYACSKGDHTFKTTRVEISVYLGLNIFISIHELPQLAMYRDSDKFFLSGRLQENNPKAPLHDSGEIFTSC